VPFMIGDLRRIFFKFWASCFGKAETHIRRGQR
jgi:hypothetical protein